jgi:hypothetical protein
MKAAGTLIVMAGMLAACGGPAPGGNGSAAAGSPTDPIEAKIRALSTPMRRLTFFRAVYDSNYGCKEIVADQELSRDAGQARWKATCDDGREFFLTLRPGGIFGVSGAPAPRQAMKPSRPMAPPAP